MLEKVRIQNFQSHRDTTVEFIPGTNVIIGASDAGKSVIFRAIVWVITNRPLGDSFRSEWGGDTIVTLWTEEGDVIQRIRTATKNEYKINGKTLTAFGTEVPEQVTELLRLDSNNIQSQMDPAFLLAMTPGEAARMLNRAASIDDIDIATSGISKALSRYNSDLKYIQGTLEKDRERLKEYDSLPEIELLIQEAEELAANKANLIESIQSLKAYRQSLKETQLELAKTNYVSKALEEVDKAIELNRRKTLQQASFESLQRLSLRANLVEKELEDLESLPELSGKVELAEKNLKKYQIQLDNYVSFYKLSSHVRRINSQLKETENVDKAYKAYDYIVPQLDSWRKTQKAYDSLKEWQLMAQKTSDSIIRIDKAIEKLSNEYEGLVPDICPLCGGEMKGCQD